MTTSSPAPTSEPEAGGIRYTDRVFIAGVNGSGKSVLINHIATRFACQRFLYDTKEEFDVPGVTPVRSIAEIDWSLPLIHYVDDAGDLDDTNRLFRVFWQRKASGRAYGLIVVVHELADLCADQPGKTPQWVGNYIRKGRAHGLGLIAGSQRPRNIPRAARSECQHVFSFAQGFDPEDVPVMAGLHRMTVSEFERALEQAAQLGQHAYLWGDRRARTNVIRPALPEQLRARTIAQGIDPSAHSRNVPGTFPESDHSGNVAGTFPESDNSSGRIPGTGPGERQR